LWDAVQSEYNIQDVGGLELLAEACAARDRVEAVREAIDRDGVAIKTRTGVRSHPLLRDEIANRSFVVRTLERLGITVETIKPVGRPPKG
jgi:hypothetical protein